MLVVVDAYYEHLSSPSALFSHGKYFTRLALVLAQSNAMYQLLMFAVGSGRTRAVSLRSERAMSRGFPSLELDTVVEERSDPDPEMTTTEVLVTPDS
jgi:hypothetical protein